MNFGFRDDSTKLLLTRSVFSPLDDPSSQIHCQFPPPQGRNVLSMLVQREISPNAKFLPRKRRYHSPMKQTGQSLLSWVEAESLQHLTAKYCPFEHSPRSTIAVDFSSDGKTLASTHFWSYSGDHTVKITDFQTGNCLKVLSGHLRTPWVVRFHPLHSEIVASGSLDQNVRLWNVTTSECIKSHEFDKPIASIAFHAEGELLAVASGHKLHMWHYNRSGEESTPILVLKTRRSLRAVHFHPHGAPFLMTAEVIDPLDHSMSLATSGGYLSYPPPAIYFTSPGSSQDLRPVPIPQTVGRNRPDLPELGHFFQFSDQVSWELPFRQGWLMARGHGVSPPNIGSSASTPSLEAGVALTELPCTVKLCVWRHDMRDPFAQMKSDSCLLTIPHVVLCSEMGAHLSPCGRYIAACVACVAPHAEPEIAQQELGLATSPIQHPVTAHQVIYELRVYSLQKESFGSVLVSREIRAAHCLTSIQFSPTSEHILLAYGRYHRSLLNSIVCDAEAATNFFTVLEIYRVSDMELVRVFPSSEDEVNVACFHPSPGGGLVYGTKEGSLRTFQYNTGATSTSTGPNTYPEDNLSEVA